MSAIEISNFKDTTIWTTYTRGIAVKEYFAQNTWPLNIVINIICLILF